MKDSWGFASLWKDHQFTQRLISIAFDEGHCISKWASFRQDYREVSRLRYLVPNHIRYYVVSATFPNLVLGDTKDSLRIRDDQLYLMHRSNDRPNIDITVRQLAHPANSFLDLAFLVPENPPPGWKPPKFLIFFDDIAESIRAAKFLRSRLPLNQRSMIKWFNSDMSAKFREKECENLRLGHTWGLLCTDSFGMVRLRIVVKTAY
jgi:ATP-dependent DNA helicase RecQ